VGTHPGACRNVQVDRLWAGGSRCNEYDSTISDAPYYFPSLPGFTRWQRIRSIPSSFSNWHGGVLGVESPAELTRQEAALSDQLVAAWTWFRAQAIRTGEATPMAAIHGSGGCAAVLSENVPALSTFTAGTVVANHHCDASGGKRVERRNPALSA